MNIYIVENNRLVGTNTYPDVAGADYIVVDGVRSELEDVDQVDGVYYYEKINANKSITNYTTVTKVAKALDWINNSIMITDTEVSELNGWTYLKGYAPKKPLEAFKEEKHAELKSIMQAKRKALTCEYANDVFDCNEQAQANMTSLMSFANLGMTEFFIRSTNERTHTFTAEQLVELATLMSKTVNDLYTEYWSYKNALYECKTKEEIAAIEWEI